MASSGKHTHRKHHSHQRHTNRYVGDGTFIDDIEEVEPLPNTRFDGSEKPAFTTASLAPATPEDEDLSQWDGELPNQGAAPNRQAHRKKIRRKRRKQRMGTAKKVLLGVLGTLVVLVAAVAIAGGLYVNKIGEEISFTPQQQQEIKEALSPAPANDNSFYMLVAAIDERAIETNDDLIGRTDVLMLVRVDPDRKVTTLVTIPRDTPWTNDKGEVHRINEAMVQGGAPMMIDAVQKLTGVPISHYAEVNFIGFRNLVDLVGGVTVDLPQDVEITNIFSGNTYALSAGNQELTSDAAEALVRVRKPYESGDSTRQSVNRQVLLDLVKRLAQLSPLELPGAIQVVAESIGTDMTVTEMANLAPSLLGDMTVYQAAGPYDGDYNEALGGLWMCYEDPDGWARLMEMVKAGEDPSGISYKDDHVTVAGTGGQEPATRPNYENLT